MRKIKRGCVCVCTHALWFQVTYLDSANRFHSGTWHYSPLTSLFLQTACFWFCFITISIVIHPCLISHCNLNKSKQQCAARDNTSKGKGNSQVHSQQKSQHTSNKHFHSSRPKTTTTTHFRHTAQLFPSSPASTLSYF